MRKVKIFIADSNTLTREGVKSILSKNESITIIGEAKESKSLKLALKKLDIEILIIDFFNTDSFHIDDLLFLRKNYPKINILVVSSNFNPTDIFTLIDLEVKGYLLKECDEDEIFKAIQSIAKNEKFFCPKVVDLILEKHLNLKKDKNTISLSQRELEIVQLFAGGLTAKEIAHKLYLSHHTINTHRKNILKKLKVNSTTELILYAIRFGINTSNNENIPQ